MKNHYLFALISIILIGFNSTAQETYPPSQIIEGTFIRKTERLDQFQVINQNDIPEVPTMVIDQIVTESKVPFNTQNEPQTIFNLQTEPGQIQSLPLEQNFIGANQSESGFLPPDPTGAVGPDHYMHSVNSIVKIFDKTGNLLVGPVSLGAFLGIGSNNGDPIILYDQLADRWVVTEFGNLGGNLGLAIGVSVSADPAGEYNVYQYDLGGFPDYPKYGLWHDGYYGTANFIWAGPQSVAGFVMERDALLAGDPSPQLVLWEQLPGNIHNPQQVRGGNPVNLLGTAIDPSTPGYFTYIQDDGWSSAIPFDHIKIWEVEVDWDNTANSTISTPLEIATDPFDAGELFGNGNGAIRQPGTSQRLAGHGGITSFNVNYRSFNDHNSFLTTFNTFIDADETGGIRWVELRNDGVNDWSLYQEGTYAIADGHSRVMSSAAMDAQGNIAMGYTTASTTLPVSLRYTGRFEGDPLGVMTIEETVIVDGPGVRTNTNRYGDYAHMTLDPDNFTFWYTGDYFSSNNVWETRIASMTLSGGFAADVGVNEITQPNNGLLSSSETVEISIRNFGTAAQTDIPVELVLDGVVQATETFIGTIEPGEVATYTFTQTIDLSTPGTTYVIEAITLLNGDQFVPNDDFVKEVTHLLGSDVGPLELTAPSSGSGLGLETISVNLKNFGADTQSNFDVQYTVNGGTPVVETFTGSLASEEEVVFDFSTQADLSELGTYEIVITTNLSGDQDASNDVLTVEVDNVLCQPEADCSLGDGFQLFSVAEINNPSACEGYGDFTDQIAFLEADTTYELTVTTGWGDQYVTVWIDFNDDNNFTNDEKVVTDWVIAPGSGAGSYTETTDLVVPEGVPPGEHRMRAKSNWNAPVPNDPCEETTYGETEDYTANTGELGIGDYLIQDSELFILTNDNNQFEVILQTEYEEGVFLSVFNLLGQNLGFNKSVPKIDGAFRVNLDMSRLSSGIYIVRMGGQGTTSYKTGQLIVK